MRTIPSLRILLLALLIALSQTLFCPTADSQTVERIATREVARRKAALSQGEAALVRGKEAMKQKNYTVAHEEFRVAVTYLPDAVVSGKAHDEAVDGFCESGIKLAEQKIADGKYNEAEFYLTEILNDRYNPNCRPASDLLVKLRTPGYFNRTMGPKFIAKVEDVKRLLTEADGYYASGRYDLAFKKYEQVLALDPYNTAARKGQEKIDNTKYQYGEQAYNETRARQLWQVEKGWEEPVRQYGQAIGPLAESFQKDTAGTARINNKLNTIIIPRIEFRDASIREAIDFLRQQAAANDPAPRPRGKKGCRYCPAAGSSGRPCSRTGATSPSTSDSAAGRCSTRSRGSRGRSAAPGRGRTGPTGRACNESG